jgi:flagellar basal-body rod protein FlgF/flagellar basal-body rod protein FlgG
MYYGMYVAAACAHAQGERLEVINHNIANAGTAGFKRELGVLQARASEAIERGMDFSGSRTINDLGGGVAMTQTTTDFTEGPLRETHVDTDMALDRPNSFFVVEKDGEEFLTRSGNFHFLSTGTLVTDQGYPVLGADGGPIQIDPQLPFSVSPAGEIVQGGEARPLGIKQPAALGDLVRVGENLFQTIGEETAAVPADERRVHWRHLEMSSVQPHTEMIRMIETSRAYEANVRMIQNHDNILGSLLSRVLRA